jgi:uncharacterized cupin superfamily protein
MDTGVLAAGNGKSFWIVGDRYTIKARGRDMGGAFALIEAIVYPGGGPPPHIDGRKDEAFYILERELALHADGRDLTAVSCEWVTFAKGSLHF